MPRLYRFEPAAILGHVGGAGRPRITLSGLIRNAAKAAVDPLEKRLERLRSYSESASRRAGLYREVAGLADRGASESVGAVRRAPAPGRKLQKIGFIMLWIPEPTMITAAVGGPMILAGRYLDTKYNGATVSDVGEHTKETLQELGRVREQLR